MHIIDTELYPTIKKNYVYKVYAKSSYEWDNFKWDIGNWSTGSEKALVGIWRNDVISSPTFQSVLNSGDAEMQVRLARDFDNYGEDVDIGLNHTVDLYVYDKEKPNGELIFRGYISSYAPVLEDDNSYLQIYVKGIVATLANRILRDSDGNTTLNYLSQDPSNILKDIITKFRDIELGEVYFTTESIEMTGTVVSYEFSNVTYKEALDKVLELCPVYWFYRVEPSGLIVLKEKTSIIDHQISTKKDIVYLSPEKNLEDFANDIYFTGGEVGGSNLYLRKQNFTSIDDYGRFSHRIVDGRVTDTTTAQIMINKYLLEKGEPTRRTVVRIIDSNGNNFPSNIGYDIETIKVGQNINISEITGAVPDPTWWDNFSWDSALWDNLKSSNVADIMQIYSISYSPDVLELEATTRLPAISKRIEDIKRNLDIKNYLLNPNSPTNF